MFVGRENELKILHDALKSESSSFIAVYGRRRVGKTFLIDTAFKNEYFFSVTGVYPKKKQSEIDQFVYALRNSGANIDKSNYPKKWIDAFYILQSLITAEKSCKKKIIFMDELAWLSAPTSEFISALSGFWNGFASKRNDIVLIVCASAASWMTDNIIHNKGGLYQRLTAQIFLKPFSLGECEKLSEKMGLNFDRYSILEGYMALGGIPFYWLKLDASKSMDANLDNLFAGDNAILKNEFSYLYSSLFENSKPYIDIINVLGHDNISVGLTREEILLKLKIKDGGLFSKHLKELEDCGFIRHFKRYGQKGKGIFYQLIDNYTLFYYKFLEKGITDNNFFSHSIDLPSRKAWSGLAFEKVCFSHIEQIKKAIGVAQILNDISSFSVLGNPEKGIVGSQIDLVIESRDRTINLCEIKYSNDTYLIDKKYDEILKRKKSDFVRATDTKYTIKTTMITTYGVYDNSYRKNIDHIVTMEDLFK